MDDLEKLRSIRQGGKTKGKARVKNLVEGGKVRGVQVEYHDGRVEAVVRPQPLRAKFSVSRQEPDE